MVEKGGRFHDHGPIQPGEGKEIAADAERFLREQAQQEIVTIDNVVPFLPPAPDHLIRRFAFRAQPGPYDSWIPWDELHEEAPQLAQRLTVADKCKQHIYRAFSDAWDSNAGRSVLTPADVYAVYNERRSVTLSANTVYTPREDFDLHDVYTCTEDDLLELHTERLRFSPTTPPAQRDSNRQITHEFEKVLDLVGQAIPRSR